MRRRERGGDGERNAGSRRKVSGHSWVAGGSRDGRGKIGHGAIQGKEAGWLEVACMREFVV